MSKAFDVTLVSYDGAPEGAPDDQLLAEAIRGLGGSARFAVWDDDEVDWSASATTVIRSTWDYFRKQAEWRNWLTSIEGETRLVNSAPVVRWNMDKSYLLDLAKSGIPIVPTVIVRQAEQVDLPRLCADRYWIDIVVKPSVAGSAHGARRFPEDRIATEGVAHLRHLTSMGDALVQPYQTAVEHERERSLVVIGGAFGHAFSKSAFNPGAAAGGSSERDHKPTTGEVEFAQRALAAVGAAVTYARVDIVPTAEGPRLMELELIEPNLGLRRRPASALALAKSVLDHEC